ncbi:hypothetical protein ACPT8I_13345 [Lactiplantibacillus plantarum]|uniref:hypothetical protein n=1 Tax=Lactiplantibacillus plantarum TaxID=1590 RepID=UPI0010722DB1|nr:hypothetical protein [Lactiplantibacillus plantarum]BEI46067.1 hypothetical protein IYO2065_05710 [Lactiplantibacillus plantarum]
MKILYFWDSNFKLVNSVFYQNEEDMPSQMPSNATEVAPADGLYAPSWNGSSWVGIDEDTWRKDNPAVPVTPSDYDKTTASILIQIANLKATQATQASKIEQLGGAK